MTILETSLVKLTFPLKTVISYFFPLKSHTLFPISVDDFASDFLGGKGAVRSEQSHFPTISSANLLTSYVLYPCL